VPPEQFVEMRVVFRRELPSSTGGARVEPGDGLQEIMDQEAAEAQSEAREARQTRLHALFTLLFVFFVGAVTVMMALVSLRYGGVWFGGGGGASAEADVEAAEAEHGSRGQLARNRASGA
jgi:hypothetical protein